MKATEDNRKQLTNNIADYYKNELLISNKEKYLKMFIMKD